MAKEVKKPVKEKPQKQCLGCMVCNNCGRKRRGGVIG